MHMQKHPEQQGKKKSDFWKDWKCKLTCPAGVKRQLGFNSWNRLKPISKTQCVTQRFPSLDKRRWSWCFMCSGTTPSTSLPKSGWITSFGNQLQLHPVASCCFTTKKRHGGYHLPGSFHDRYRFSATILQNCSDKRMTWDDYLLWFPINNGWGEPSIHVVTINPPLRHLHQVIARRAKGHQGHGGGVLWFQRWRLRWNCWKRRPSNKNHFQPFSHLPKKPYAALIFQGFFLVKCWIFLGTFREFICSPDCFDLVFDAQVPLTIINGLSFWWAVSVAMLLLTLGCSVSDKWR